MIKPSILKIPPVFIILVFILAFFWEHLIPFNGNFIGGIDVKYQFWWNAHFIKEQFLSGSIPLWNPHYYSGHPFLANPVTTVFYPFTLLVVLLPLHWAFTLDTILHVFLAALGMWYFVSLLTKTRYAGIASAIIYCLSGYFIARIFAGHHTLVRAAALIPWIFYFFEKGYLAGKSKYFAASGLILGLQILSSDPQINTYTSYFILIYAIARHCSAPRSLRIQPFVRYGLYFSLIPIVAFGISAVQIIPSLEFMTLSDRAKNSYEFATSCSFPFKNFFTFLVSEPQTEKIFSFWEMEGYFGILSIALAGIGGLFSNQRRYLICFGVILLVTVTIMLGHFTPVYHLYYKYIPGISTFRVPARCMVIFVFSMAVFAGFGVRYLCESPLTSRQHIILMAVVSILLLCLFSGIMIFQVPIDSKEIILAAVFFVSTFIILNLIRTIKNKRVAAGLLIAAVFIELYLVHASKIPIANQAELMKKNNYELMFENDPGFYRVNLPCPNLLSDVPSRGMAFNYYGANGYTNLIIQKYFDFIYNMTGLSKPMGRHTLSPQIFQADSVFISRLLGIKYGFVKTRSGYEILTAQNVMPRAVLVRDAVILPQLEEHMEYIKRSDFDPEKTVLLESVPENHSLDFGKDGAGSSKDDKVSIVNYQANRIQLRSKSTGNSYLVLSELFYPGWYAYVDGEEVPILRADYLLRAIQLKPGLHDIVFLYRPMSFLLGASISVFTLLILGGIYLRARKKKKSPNQT